MGCKNSKKAHVKFGSNFLRGTFICRLMLRHVSALVVGHQLLPKYLKNEVNGNNKPIYNTRKLTVKYRLNQELRFIYTRKQELNEKLCIKRRWPTCRSINQQINVLYSKLLLNCAYVIQLHGNCATLTFRHRASSI